MSATWIRDPLAILTPAGEDARGGLVVSGSRIVELVPGGQQPRMPYDETFDASEHVLLPGLVNTHHHFFQTMTRAHPAGLNKPLFPWLAGLYEVWNRFTPEALALASRLAYVELLLSGCTTAADHHYLYPAGLESAVDIQVDEARRLGVRTIVLRGSMSDRDGGVTPPDLIQDEDAILADSERVLQAHHDAAPNAMTQVALAPCSPFNVSPYLMRESAALAERYDCRLHTHCGETTDEIDYCLDHFGVRPLEHLEDVGWIQKRTWIAHGIHFTDREIAALGAARVGVAHCPTSNMLLASGQCRTLELEQHGAPVGLGVDGSASNDSSNLMEAVRHALLLNRLRYGAERVTHLDVLRWATAGSAAVLGRTDIGSIQVGKAADLALFRLDAPRFAGAHDPLAALVLCGAHRADRVMVNGEWRVVAGQPVGVDLEQLVHDHHDLARRLFA